MQLEIVHTYSLYVLNIGLGMLYTNLGWRARASRPPLLLAALHVPVCNKMEKDGASVDDNLEAKKKKKKKGKKEKTSLVVFM